MIKVFEKKDNKVYLKSYTAYDEEHCEYEFADNVFMEDTIAVVRVKNKDGKIKEYEFEKITDYIGFEQVLAIMDFVKKMEENQWDA